MNLLRKAIGFAVMSLCLCVGSAGMAKTILYVPQDNRPVDLAYTVGTAESAGYTIITPPEHYLSGSNFQGSPDALMSWVDANANKADAMVLSVDSLVYGGLVDSRKHNLDMNTLMTRLEKVESLHNKYSIPLYVFSTVMRSPWAGGKGVEPDYYLNVGSDIYQLASLQAKMDGENLSPQERSDWFAIMRRMPMEYFQDWFNRRHKNMAVNYRLIDDARKGTFTYFSLGHDDNSVNTQSSLESKYLEMAGAEIPKTSFGSFPGADQLGLLLITRANNDFNNYHPKVTVIYPLGGGEKTVPSYDGQAIGKTIAAHVEAIGGTITTTEKPDLLLAVNTPLTTSTSESGNFENFPIMLQSTRDFLTQIETSVQAGIPTSIVDMAFSNGSDNTLVYGLYQDKMMYRLAAYNGWNTASNSVGYGIAQGVLSKYMTPQGHQNMLTVQYLDNWAYQANVRDYVYRMQQKVEAGTVKRYYPTVMGELQSLTKEQLQRYAQTYLGLDPSTINVSFPWNRLFEVYVQVKPAGTVPVEAVVRQDMKEQELEALQAQVVDAQKAADKARKADPNAPIDPKLKQKLVEAEQAAKARYEEEQQNQKTARTEEKAQQNRTWMPAN